MGVELEQDTHQDQDLEQCFSKYVPWNTPSTGWEYSKHEKKGSGGQTMLERQSEMKLRRLFHCRVLGAS